MTNKDNAEHTTEAELLASAGLTLTPDDVTRLMIARDIRVSREQYIEWLIENHKDNQKMLKWALKGRKTKKADK